MSLHDFSTNATLPLELPASGWRVCSGSWEIYREELRGGEPISPRRHLFACPTRSLLLGGSQVVDGVETRLIASATQDSQLLPLQIIAQDADPAFAEQIDAWVQGVARACGQHAPQGPVQRAVPGRAALLAEGESLQAAPGTVAWAKVATGSVIWTSGIVPDDDALLLPLCDGLGLVARENSEVELFATVALAPPEVIAGLTVLHLTLFGHLRALSQQEAETAGLRAIERDQVAARQTETVLKTWQSVFRRRPGPTRRETPLRSAVAAAAHELGIAVKFPPLLDEEPAADDALDMISRLSRVRLRRVQLSGEWWRRDAGPLIVFHNNDGRPAVLVRRNERYLLWNPSDESARVVDAEVAADLAPQATLFIRPFPDRARSLVDVARFAFSSCWKEAVVALLLSAVVSVLGMFGAPAMGMIVDHCIPTADRRLLLEIGLGLLVIGIGNSLLSLSQSIVGLRSMTILTSQLQTAVIDRLLRLKAGFFRKYSSGDLLNRSMMIAEMGQEMTGAVLGGLFSGGMALLNLGLCLYYSPRLAMIALLAGGITAGVTAIMSRAIRGRAIELEETSGKLFGVAVQMVNGITKLRVAGAEQRAFNHWALAYGKQLSLRNELRSIEDWSHRFDTILQSGSLIALFAFAAAMLTAGPADAGPSAGAMAALSLGSFLAFHAAFHGLVDGITQLCTTIVSLSDQWAKKDLIAPLLNAELEVESDKIDPGPLEGRLAIENVTFRYRDDGPLILDKVRLFAEPGEFIALVGPSGSGKSTLLRLLLGFDQPASGVVLYDRQDLTGLDMSSVRRQIGTVLQNGQITAGSIFTNITAGARGTMEEALEAARDAGLGEDIEKMPMQLHTVINEGGRNLSGGQRQRMLIARALFANPRILFFDEATSALDNRTQQIVSRSIQRRRVTRVVVAHRLSTIKDADRIYVLEAGRVTQVGTYEELSTTPGLFQRMVERQTV